MAKIFGKNSSVVKYDMYSRMGRALKFQHRLVINSGVKQSDTRTRKSKANNITFKTPEKVPVNRPTSSFAVVDREHVFCAFQPVGLILEVEIAWEGAMHGELLPGLQAC